MMLDDQRIPKMLDRAKTVYEYIIDFKRKHDGISPTYSEIMGACSITSKSLVYYYINNLMELGYIKPIGRGERGLIVTGGEWTLKIQ